jgi:hypothetical protein
MTRRLLHVLAIAAGMLTACAGMNVKKQCYGNGVCRVEKDGVVSWEGPPDKVAELKGKEDARDKAVADADKAWIGAPKRAADEPIRLLVVGPDSEHPELRPLAGTYRQMIEQSLQGDARIQLVPHGTMVKLLVGGDSDDRGSRGNRPAVRAAVDEGLARRLRESNVDVDVVLVAHLATKKVSGFVSGGKGGGVGVAEVNNVQLDASLSSVYRFEEHRTSQVGKSTDSLAVAGIGKDGKKGSGELKGKRNPEQDRPAVQSCAAWVRSTVGAKIAPELPSLAAVKEIRAKNSAANGGGVEGAMRKLFGGK